MGRVSWRFSADLSCPGVVGLSLTLPWRAHRGALPLRLATGQMESLPERSRSPLQQAYGAVRLSRLGEADHALGDDGAGGLTAR
jgi:hypothetical protein